MNRLPVELVQEIASYLPNRRDVFHFSVVCRRLNNDLCDFSYRSLDLTEYDIVPLAETILACPTMGTRLRTLAAFEVGSEPWALRQLGRAVRNLTRTICENHHDLIAWQRKLQKSSLNGWLLLLLGLTPNLRQLRIDNTTWDFWILFGDIVHQLCRPEKPPSERLSLQRLETLAVTVNRLYLSFRPAWSFLFIFALPSLTTVRLQGVQDALPVAEDAKAVREKYLLSRTSRVTSLSFDTPCNGFHGMADLTSACLALVNFSYQHDSRVCILNAATFRPAGVYNSILEHKDTLKSLDLNTKGEFIADLRYKTNLSTVHDGNVTENDFFGSFVQFEKLESIALKVRNALDFRTKVMYLSQYLPSGIIRLRLAHCTPEAFGFLVENLADLAANRRQFSSLEDVTVLVDWAEEAPDTLDHESPFRMPLIVIAHTEPLKESFKSQGVSLNILLHDPPLRGRASIVWSI